MAHFHIRQKPDWKKRLFALLICLTIFFIAVYIAGSHINKTEKLALLMDTKSVTQAYNQHDFEGKTDSLKALFGRNKRLPEGYELQTLLVLSHYPELADIHIHFFQTEAIIPLASRPEPFTMLYSKKEWQYNRLLAKVERSCG